MHKYPKINYIGNKNNLVEWIIENLPCKTGKILDLFSGGSSVAYALKDKGYTVYTNDILYSNYVLSKAIIENQNIQLNEQIFDTNVNITDIRTKYRSIKFLTNKLYYEEEVRELARLLCISDTIKNEYERYLFLALVRRALIRKLPYSRMNVPWTQIQKLRDEDYSYEKYKRRRAYHNLTFEYHMRDNLKNYNDSIFDNRCKNKAYHHDALELAKRIKDKLDVVYMDPPYPGTMNKYNDFYGAFDKIFDEKKNCLDLTNKATFLDNFEKIIKTYANKTKYIVISENNRTIPSVDELCEMLKKYGSVKTYHKEHQYKVTGKELKNNTQEVLIVVKTKEPI